MSSAQYQHHSFVRGYHVYKKIWTPYVGEVLQAIQEPYKSNPMDDFAVKLVRNGDSICVGHVPKANSCVIWNFLKRGKVYVRVDGPPINRGFQKGQEVRFIHS